MSWLRRTFRREPPRVWPSGVDLGSPVEPEDATPRQIRIARFRVFRDDRMGRETPEYIRRIAAAPLPEDPPAAAHP